jgi:hypothetical protein
VRGIGMVIETKRDQVKGKRTQEERNYRLCHESFTWTARVPIGQRRRAR